PRSLTYTLEPQGDVAVAAWGDECDLTADDLLMRREQRTRQTTGQQAAEAIRELLAEGPRPPQEMEAELRHRGFGGKSIRDGYRQAGVQSKREGFPARAMWSLPTVAPAPNDGDMEDPGPTPRDDAP